MAFAFKFVIVFYGENKFIFMPVTSLHNKTGLENLVTLKLGSGLHSILTFLSTQAR